MRQGHGSKVTLQHYITGKCINPSGSTKDGLFLTDCKEPGESDLGMWILHWNSSRIQYAGFQSVAFCLSGSGQDTADGDRVVLEDCSKSDAWTSVQVEQPS